LKINYSMNREQIEQQHLLYGRISPSVNRLYVIAILLVAGMLAISFILELDVTVKAEGITRPAAERTLVRAAISGTIDSIFVKEGARVKKGDMLALLYDGQGRQSIKRLEENKKEKLDQLADLQLLCDYFFSGKDIIKMLSTTVYAEQLLQFRLTYEEKKLEYNQLIAEHSITRKLLRDGIIARAEYVLKESKIRQLASRLASMQHQQMVHWNNEIQFTRKDLGEIDQELARWIDLICNLQLKAPVSGIIQGIHDRYSTGLLQAGEILCSVSPEDTLVAECYISQHDIGFLRLNQQVSFRILAFDHRQFGKIIGTVISIDDDFSSLNDRTFFKIRCSLTQATLSLKNGYKAKLLKGLAVQANFLITRRTVWQLISDKLSDWMYPMEVV
jgi:multidrug efflux pump subunit AcrA (membrane-fusion protein)